MTSLKMADEFWQSLQPLPVLDIYVPRNGAKLRQRHSLGIISISQSINQHHIDQLFRGHSELGGGGGGFF